MRIFFTLALVTGLLNSVWADNKKPALAGVYVGVVEGDKARAILKADGTMLVYPNDDEPGTVLRGFWKADGNTVTAKLAFVDGDQGTVVFHRDGADLILRKIINPDGEVNELTAPHFAKKKALADKGPAGIYTAMELRFSRKSLIADSRFLRWIHQMEWKPTKTVRGLNAKNAAKRSRPTLNKLSSTGYPTTPVYPAFGRGFSCY